jgi:hypothetical protein
MNNLFLPLCFGSIILCGTVIGLPDLGWISLVVTGTWWLNTKFNKIDRQFDQLPCNRCPESLHAHKNKSAP